LDLRNNQLTGEIPVEIGNLTNLENLLLSGHGPTSPYYMALRGSIPIEVFNLINLKVLWLGGNELSGQIPPEIGNLINLWDFRVGGNNFRGVIPEEIGYIPLEVMGLNTNQFTGFIPETVCNLNLEPWWAAFTFFNNKLCPPYPECTTLYVYPELQDTSECYTFLGYAEEDIDFLQSMIDIIAPYYDMEYPDPSPLEIGTQIWEEIDGVPRLVYFECQGYIPGGVPHCSGAPGGLSGPFPQNIVNVKHLRELHLPNNNLTGTIPPEICHLKGLTGPDGRFNVIHNNLCPRYPSCGEVSVDAQWQNCISAIDVGDYDYCNPQLNYISEDTCGNPSCPDNMYCCSITVEGHSDTQGTCEGLCGYPCPFN